MRLLYYIIVVAILAGANNHLFAQYTDTPLKPAKDKEPGWNGFLFGIGQNFQSGEYNVDCIDCQFDGGVNTGFTLGVSYDRAPLPWLKYGASLMYDYSGIENTFTENENVSFELDNGNIREVIPIEFRHNASVDVHLLTLMPYVKLEPFSFYFVRLGFGAGYIFSSNITHEKELLQNSATLSNGATVSVSIPNTRDNKVTIQDSPIRDLNSLQMYLMPATGFKFDFSPTTYLMTYIQFNVPFTNISDNGTDYKINQWRLFLELGFKMH